jgi:hypothetical protein
MGISRLDVTALEINKESIEIIIMKISQRRK